MNHKKIIADALRALRSEVGVTQRAFAQEIGVPQSTVYRWEAATVAPSGRYMKSIHEFARKHDIDFSPFEAPGEASELGETDETIEAVALRLLRAQAVFCATVDRLQETEEGQEAWQILQDPIQRQRKRIKSILDDYGKGEKVDFWHVVSALKIFAWRSPRPSQEDLYLDPDQIKD